MQKLLAIISVVLFANQASAGEFNFPINNKSLSLSSDLYCQDFNDKTFTHFNKVTEDFAAKMNKGVSEFVAFFWLCNAKDRYLSVNPNLQLSSNMSIDRIDENAPGLTQDKLNDLFAGTFDKIDISEMGMGNDPQKAKELIGEGGFSFGERKAIKTSTYATFITNFSSETLSYFIIQTNKYLDPYIFQISMAVAQTSEDPLELAIRINSAVKTSEEIANSMDWN